MSSPVNRRDFLAGVTSAAAVTGLGDFRFLNSLPPLSAAQVEAPPAMVQLSPDIEPLVRFVEDTPRARLIDEAARRVRGGTSYQQLLAALMLAGVRNIRPRPVGFQFHTVLVVNSAHLATIAAHDQDRWLPLLWALDNFKASQATDRGQNNWHMSPVNESRLPAAHLAQQRFTEAMDNWDGDAADAAVTALVRHAGAGAVIETFWRYGARDFRDIGHKIIFTANGWRTLQTIGWRHAEPVLRSLTDALMAHEGDNPARRNAPADEVGRENLQRLRRIREHWQQGRPAPSATTELLAALRSGTASEASEQVVRTLNNQADPAAVWDALFLVCGELLMRRPDIVGLHCVTSMNALHYGYQCSGNDETRRFLMLQAAGFMAMFRGAIAQRGGFRNADLRIDTLEPLDPAGEGDQAIEDILADVSRDRIRAARKVLGLLRQDAPARAEALMAGARRLVFTKGNNAHDYKFSSAALEDFYHASPAWRNRFLSSAMFSLRGAGDADNNLIRRAREALGRA
jgi:hypothetical protein